MEPPGNWTWWPMCTALNTRWQCFTRAEDATDNSQVMPTPKTEKWTGQTMRKMLCHDGTDPMHCVGHITKPLGTTWIPALSWKFAMPAPGRLRQEDSKFESTG